MNYFCFIVTFFLLIYLPVISKLSVKQSLLGNRERNQWLQPLKHVAHFHLQFKCFEVRFLQKEPFTSPYISPSHLNIYCQEAHTVLHLCISQHRGFYCFCRMLLHRGSYKHLYRFQKTVVTEKEPFTVYTNSEQRNIATASGNWHVGVFCKSLTGRTECLRFIFDRT